jgi:hypothetical protein
MCLPVRVMVIFSLSVDLKAKPGMFCSFAVNMPVAGEVERKGRAVGTVMLKGLESILPTRFEQLRQVEKVSHSEHASAPSSPPPPPPLIAMLIPRLTRHPLLYATLSRLSTYSLCPNQPHQPCVL